MAFAGVNLATQAAFPDTPEKSLSENQDFWSGIATTETDQTQPQAASKGETPQKPQVPTAGVRVDAKSYLVADLQTGELLAGKRIHTPRPIASLTKLMTTVVAHETIGGEAAINITESAAATYGSAGNLTVGDTLSLSTLYYPLLLSSSNDAAAAIAEHAGYERFLNQMNRKALAVGMPQARFADASGLSVNNVASPRDIIALTQYIHNQHPFIFSITASAQKTVPRGPRRESAVFTNNHPLHSQANFLGGKNGYTDEARHTLLSVFEIKKGQTTRPVAIVVLGSDKHIADTEKLLEWTTQI